MEGDVPPHEAPAAVGGAADPTHDSHDAAPAVTPDTASHAHSNSPPQSRRASAQLVVPPTRHASIAATSLAGTGTVAEEDEETEESTAGNDNDDDDDDGGGRRRRRNFATPAANLTKVLQDATRVAEALGKAQKARKEREERVKETLQEAKDAGLIDQAGAAIAATAAANPSDNRPPTPQDVNGSPPPHEARLEDSVSMSALASPDASPIARGRQISEMAAMPPAVAVAAGVRHHCDAGAGAAPVSEQLPPAQAHHRGTGPYMAADPQTQGIGGGYSGRPITSPRADAGALGLGGGGGMYEDMGDFYEDADGTDTHSSPTSDFFFTSEQITELCEERCAAARAGNVKRAEEIKVTLWRQGVELDDSVGKWVASDGRLGHYEYKVVRKATSPSSKKIDDETYNRLLGKKRASERCISDAAATAVAAELGELGADGGGPGAPGTPQQQDVMEAVRRAAEAAGVDGDLLASIALQGTVPETPTTRSHRTPPSTTLSHGDASMDPLQPFTEAYCDTGYSSVHPQTPERISPTHVQVEMLDSHLGAAMAAAAEAARASTVLDADADADAELRDLHCDHDSDVDVDDTWTTPPRSEPSFAGQSHQSQAHSHFTSASAQPGPPPFAPGERLYYKSAALDRLKQEKLERQREAKMMDELGQVTAPRITARAKHVTGNFHERQAEWEKKVRTNREEAKVLLESEHRRTEIENKRAMTKRSEVINKRTGAGRGPLAEWQQRFEKHQRMKTADRPAPSFQPKITATAAKLGSRGNAADRLYSDAATRRVRHEAKVNEEAERSQYDRNTGQVRFIPQTTATSHQSTSPPRSPPGHAQVRGGVLFTRVAKAQGGESNADHQETVIHRLLSQGQMATRRRQQREAARNEVEHAKPQMSRVSKEINQRIPRRPLYETASREQCNGVQHGSVLFSKSAVGGSGASSAGDLETRTVCSVRSSASFDGFAQRSALHEKQRMLKLERMRKSKEATEMSNCTFQPAISRNSQAIFKMAEQRSRSRSVGEYERFREGCAAYAADGPPLPYIDEDEDDATEEGRYYTQGGQHYHHQNRRAGASGSVGGDVPHSVDEHYEDDDDDDDDEATIPGDPRRSPSRSPAFTQGSAASGATRTPVFSSHRTQRVGGYTDTSSYGGGGGSGARAGGRSPYYAVPAQQDMSDMYPESTAGTEGSSGAQYVGQHQHQHHPSVGRGGYRRPGMRGVHFHDGAVEEEEVDDPRDGGGAYGVEEEVEEEDARVVVNNAAGCSLTGGAHAAVQQTYQNSMAYAQSAEQALQNWRRVSHQMPESEDDGQ